MGHYWDTPNRPAGKLAETEEIVKTMTMKIDIIGHHPTLHRGFCGVMSLYEALHLGRAGHDVQIVIPYPNQKEMDIDARRQGFSSLQSLLDYDPPFDIRPIILSDDIKLRYTDVKIWQVTNVANNTNLHRLCRENCTVFTKNFPKFVPGLPVHLPHFVKGAFESFDLVANSLKEDFHAIWSYREFALQNQHRFAYVPRGANPELLHDSAKSPVPTIAIDSPNTPDHAGIEHLFEPIRRLHEQYNELKVMNLGGPDLPFDFAENVRSMLPASLYENFFNPAWVYCVIDYSQSSPHIRGDIHSIDRTWDSKAIYEVQTIEAQMAGCIIAGYKKNIIPELVDSNNSLLWNDFATDNEILESLHFALRNRERLGHPTRERARRNFDWKNSIDSWEHALCNLVENGYDRNRKSRSVPSSLNGNNSTTSSANILEFKPNPKKSVIIDDISNKDKDLLLFDLADRSRGVAVFGFHETAKIIFRSRLDHVDIFETDMKRIDDLCSDSEIETHILSNRINIHQIDIGPTNDRGNPIERDPVKLARFSKLPWAKVNLSELDLVLIRSRFRVVTTLEAALRSNPHCLIAMHDYNICESYSTIEQHLDIVSTYGDMVIFSKGTKWNRHQAFKTVEEYRLDDR